MTSIAAATSRSAAAAACAHGFAAPATVADYFALFAACSIPVIERPGAGS